MKGRTLSILGIFAAIAGTVIIICNQSITTTGIVITGGILFMVVGLINLLFFSSGEKAAKGTGRVLSVIANAAAIVLGLSMLVFQDTFAGMIPFIFGLLVAVCALWQFFLLAIGLRPIQLPGWLYIFPILLAGCSTYIFITHSTSPDSQIMLATGVSLAVLGVATIADGIALGAANRAAREAATETTDDLDDPTESPQQSR